MIASTVVGKPPSPLMGEGWGGGDDACSHATPQPPDRARSECGAFPVLEGRPDWRDGPHQRVPSASGSSGPADSSAPGSAVGALGRTRTLVGTARGSAEIARNITSVAQASQQAAEGAGNTQKAAAELARMAAELQHLVEQFQGGFKR